ncbi:GNAT family N-acetyltransferase [Alphaproteobacteria bacterium]|nr:GNAT family N-acetyltransferase [Alphaproteobacteria bacterium]
MVPINTPNVIDLEARHLQGAQMLSEEAHWNQIQADWRMMMRAGRGIGMEVSGRLVACALTLPYGTEFGWISMVLVTKEWQKRGLATRLLQTCIERLEENGLVPVLDATLAGESVYRPLGFVPHFSFQRWEHDAVETINVRQITSKHFDAARADSVIDRDIAIFGGDRRPVIESLVVRSGEFSCLDKATNGFLLGRDGRLAGQIGPIFADGEDCAVAMLEHALVRLTGRVFIDACDHQSGFTDRLKEYGFKPQRPFLRMAKGRSESFGIPAAMFAMAGPELG